MQGLTFDMTPTPVGLPAGHALRPAAAFEALRPARAARQSLPDSHARPALCRVLRALLFADLVNFSRLSDAQLAAFLGFLGEIGRALEAVRPAGSYIRTFGDGIFAVMGSATEMLDFALTLDRTVARAGRSIEGLDRPMKMRIALHAGTIVRARDPVMKALGYYGCHVNRTARLEHVTRPGHIYATSQFVALLRRESRTRGRAAAAGTGCTCEYLGTVTLAKNFGVQRVYDIREGGKTERITTVEKGN